jgi:predicted NBD/HSP70 family sugar kinase
VKAANMDWVRKINRQRILEVIKHRQPVSRAMIARELSLSRSTVSAIVSDFISEHIVLETGTGKSTLNGGRKGTLLEFNPKSAFGIGMDIQKNCCRIILADLNGNILNSRTYTAVRDVNQLITVLERFLEEISDQRNRLIGIGVSVPSIVKDHAIVVDAPSLSWRNVDLSEQLSRVCDLPSFITNDVNAAAFGERWVGQDRQIDNLFYLYIGSGVGSSILTNGNWISGADQAAGEIGYTLDKCDLEDHEPYLAGKFGAFEQKIISLLSGKMTPEVVEELVTQLSVTIANVCSLLNPELVVIGGTHQQFFRSIMSRIQKRVNQYTPLPSEITCSSLSCDAAVIGAVEAIYRYLNGQIIDH